MSETQLQVIQPKDLKHLNELEAEIVGFKEKYLGLTIKDESDKEGYETIKSALSVMRPKRTGLDKERKSVTEPYRLAIDSINSRYNSFIDQIAEIESPLKKQKDEYEDAIEKKKQEAKEAEERKINEHVNDLLKNGASFDGNYYAIEDKELGIECTSISVVDLRTMSDELFKTLLQTVIDKNGKILAEKERLQAIKDEEERKRKLKEEEDRKIFQEQQDKLRKEQEDLQRQKDEIARQKKEQEDLIYNSRVARFVGMVNFVGVLKSPIPDYSKTFTREQLIALSEEEFSVEVATFTELKKEFDKKKAEQDEIDRKAREKQIADDAIAEQKRKEEQQKQREAEELAQKDDKTKYEWLLTQLRSIQIPEFKTRNYKGKAGVIKDFLSDL